MLELITGIVVAMVALAVVLEPLLRTARPLGFATPLPDPLEDDFQELEESESPKVRALLALREIEFDRATGKLSDADYDVLKRKYAASALEAIRAERDAEVAASDAAGTDAAEAAVAHVKSLQVKECPTCRYALEPGSVFCSRCGRSLLVTDAQPRCWVCGADLQSGSSFCSQCGASPPEGVPAA